MMFGREDFKIHDVGDFIQFLPVVVFIGLVAPFLLGAYALGFVMDVTGWLKTD